MIGAYIWTSEIGERFAAMTPPERHAAAIADGARIHGGYAGLVERGVSVAVEDPRGAASSGATTRRPLATRCRS